MDHLGRDRSVIWRSIIEKKKCRIVRSANRSICLYTCMFCDISLSQTPRKFCMWWYENIFHVRHLRVTTRNSPDHQNYVNIFPRRHGNVWCVYSGKKDWELNSDTFVTRIFDKINCVPLPDLSWKPLRTDTLHKINIGRLCCRYHSELLAVTAIVSLV